MHHVDGLQRSNHHFEFTDFTFIVPGYDVDAIDVFALDFRLEFEYGIIATEYAGLEFEAR